MKQLSKEELIDEAWEAMDDRNDMDVGLTQLAAAAVERLDQVGAFYPDCSIRVQGFRVIDLFVCGLLSALFGVGMEAIFQLIPITG